MDLELMRKRFQDSETSNLGFEIYKPKYGRNKNEPHNNKIKLFSFPPVGEGITEVGKRVLKHYGLGHDGRSQVICPKTLGTGKKCLVCEAIETWANSGDPTMVKRAESVKQQERYQMFVADWDLFEKEGKKHIGVYDAGSSINRKVKQLMLSEWGDVTLFKCNLLKIVCFYQGQGLPPSVDVQGVPVTVELDPEEWLPLFPKWESILQPSTEDYCRKAVYGEGTEVIAPVDPFSPSASKEQPAVAAVAQPIEQQQPKPQVDATTITTATAASAPTSGNSKLQELLAKHKKG